jgi:hypothetical protein
MTSSLQPTNKGRKGAEQSSPRLVGSQVANPEPEELKSWALVELFGHARLVGLVTSNPIELPGTIRVDVPDLLKNGEVARKGFTRYFGRSAIYSLTPCDEETVRKLLPSVDGAPSRPYHLQEEF